MKKNYFTILFLAAFSTWAQPTLNLQNFPTDYTAFSAEAFPGIDQPMNWIGNAGADQVWDFSSFQISMCCSHRYTALMPLSSTLYASYFPTANYCFKTTEDNMPTIYEYFKVTANGYEKLGGGADFGPSILNPARSLYQFPYTYSTQLTSDMETSIYDAYGTFIAPFDMGTFTNVIRKKTTYDSDPTEHYAWYNTNPYFILAEAMVLTDVTTYRIYQTSASGSMGVDQKIKEAALKVLPNPATTVLNLQIAADITLDKIQITDLSGKIVVEKFADFSSINIAQLAQGMYVLSAYSKNGVLQSKFLKQ